MRAKLTSKSNSTSTSNEHENSDSSNSFDVDNLALTRNSGYPIDQNRRRSNAESSDSDSSPSDNEMLKRILAGKRASEGAIKINIYGNRVAVHGTDQRRERKNSLIPNDDCLLPPVTEGVVMTKPAGIGPATKAGITYTRNKSMSQSLAESPLASSASSNSSSLQSLGARATGLNRKHSLANDLSDGRQASSSSSSLYSESDHQRRSRCSSIISQCSVTSSILSETARQQLQYSLSPDLPLDCDDLYETNEIHSCRKFARYDDEDDFNVNNGRNLIERPATPAPISPASSCDELSSLQIGLHASAERL